MPHSAEAPHARIGREGGNQVSYTLKCSMVMGGHINLVRAVSVLPQVASLSYDYQPEGPLTKAATKP
ncbi:hypothetical protein [Mesorhizobium temperatum]|uniref:Uncharacterized protein n=1 Tax=Mesorhizobium temperatum TaxID=241416 RepID=A0A271LGD0_9HYPH|nr:hypothetical protein [Mesorhizobium temperatum]PAQ07124.1 hypothetical protein CIT26_22190 [Mesorhizobium temperatum]